MNADRRSARHLGCDGEEWPVAVSDGLSIPCADCGALPPFDYRVTDEFWRTYVPDDPARLGVVCLPCLNRRCDGQDLAENLLQVQWIGTGHTVVLEPSARYVYAPPEESNDDAIDRAAAALFGELGAGALRITDDRIWTKDDLRQAARKVLWAASDPMWGRR